MMGGKGVLRKIGAANQVRPSLGIHGENKALGLSGNGHAARNRLCIPLIFLILVKFIRTSVALWCNG